VKIVFIAPFGIRPKGTLQARMLPLAAGLQRQGHRVTIVAPPYTNPEDSGKVEVVRGVTIRNIRLGTDNRILAAVLLGWRLYRAAMKEKPDLVHLFKPKGYGGLAAVVHLAAAGAGLRHPPLFMDEDDWEGKGGMNETLPYSRGEKLVFRLQEERLPPRATGLTVASRALEQRALERGISRQRLLYVPNCVEDRPAGNGAVVRERHGIPGTAPVLLLYTRFFEFSQERLHTLFQGIFRRVPDVRFLVVGKGKRGEEALLATEACRRGFSSALVMAGWVEPDRIPDYLAAGDVAVYPFSDTLVNRAKCPAKLTELLLSGVPVVADAVGQIKEYIDPDVSGILCDPHNRDEMENRTVELLQDRDTRLSLGQAGRRILLEKFTWRDAAVELEKFYLQHMASSSERKVYS
jgi:glycosyltransferase involved in cell wall biosynthesis